MYTSNVLTASTRTALKNQFVEDRTRRIVEVCAKLKQCMPAIAYLWSIPEIRDFIDAELDAIDCKPVGDDSTDSTDAATLAIKRRDVINIVNSVSRDPEGVHSDTEKKIDLLFEIISVFCACVAPVTACGLLPGLLPAPATLARRTLSSSASNCAFTSFAPPLPCTAISPRAALARSGMEKALAVVWLCRRSGWNGISSRSGSCSGSGSGIGLDSGSGSDLSSGSRGTGSSASFSRCGSRFNAPVALLVIDNEACLLPRHRPQAACGDCY